MDTRTLYAHAEHVYSDRANKTTYTWHCDQIRTLPEDVAELLLGAHPTKFCDITGMADALAHDCDKDSIATDAYASDHPLANHAPRYSPQKRELRKEATHRGRNARVAARGIGDG